jgi:hypothetical protein
LPAALVPPLDHLPSEFGHPARSRQPLAAPSRPLKGCGTNKGDRYQQLGAVEEVGAVDRAQTPRASKRLDLAVVAVAAHD